MFSSPRSNLSPLEWLIRLRWIAITGQLLVFILAKFFFVPSVTVSPFAGILAISLISNFFLQRNHRKAFLKNEGVIAGILLLDVVLLSLLLFRYGGHTNPFGTFFLFHVIISALLLKGRANLLIFLAALTGYSATALNYIPIAELSLGHQMHMDMPHSSNSKLIVNENFHLHLQGMLVGFFLITSIVSLVISRMRVELERNQLSLLRTQESSVRLSTLTTLTAGAAHELLTPLSTIHLITSEVKKGFLNRDDLFEEAGTIHQEAEKCLGILNAMGSQFASLEGELPSLIDLAEMLNSIEGELSLKCNFTLEKEITFHESVLLPKVGLRRALLSIIKNAVEAYPSETHPTVRVNLSRSEDRLVSFKIRDQGVGMSENVLSSACTPFFTTKDVGAGLGLGLFYAKLFANQCGGELEISSTPGEGTTVFFSVRECAAHER